MAHRGLNRGMVWRRVVGGVNLAAELDGAWRRGRRRAFPGAGSAGGVRAGPAKVFQGPIKSGSHRRWRIETEQGLTGVEVAAALRSEQRQGGG